VLPAAAKGGTMSRIVILGAGVSGHTAGAFARHWLGREHDVVVVSPRPDYNWIPSNIWVGVGLMKPAQVVFPLAPVYARAGIEFVQARAVALHPEGGADDARPYVVVESTAGAEPSRSEIRYDYLINATGPKLNFGATPGLGPTGHSLSVCTPDHAAAAAQALAEAVERMRRGERQRFLVGTGHGGCTCQGAAFEYIVNLEFELRARGVRDKADITWISNEYEMGDFGMGGMHVQRGGYITPSKIFTESLFAERGLRWLTRTHVRQVEPGQAHYVTLEGEERTQEFDLAMLLPPFTGVGLQAFDRAGADITSGVFMPSGFMRVDGDYAAKPYEQWSARDWPRTYQSPAYPNLFAAGIAFAPPHAISRPRQNPQGVSITPAPPRTGMPSAMIGKAVARNICDLVGGATTPRHTASMAEMGAACVASAGANPFTGTAAAMTVFPIVPDFEKYPEYGRDLDLTFGEIGLAGHWIKIILHHMFLYKARLLPGWRLIPE
jgi:sulfide:quinone oxidoreductase